MQPQIQVETDGHLRAAKVVRLKTPHGELTQIDCVGDLAIIRQRSWKSISSRKLDSTIEDEIVLEGSTEGPVQIFIQDLARGTVYLVMFGRVEEVVLGYRLEIPPEIPKKLRNLTSGVEFYIRGEDCEIIPTINTGDILFAEIRRRLG